MIEAVNLTIRNWNQKQDVLSNVSCQILPGSFLAVIGKSGVGKTTFFNALAKNAWIKGGQLLWNGFDIKGLKGKKLKNHRQQIGWIAQLDTLVDGLTVYDNLRLSYFKQKHGYQRFWNIVNKKQKEEILSWLDHFHLLPKAYSYAADLSKGERQRVEVIKLFLKNNNLILADEPTSNLDLLNAQIVFQTLKKYATEQNKIVLVNIHNVDQLLDMFEHVLVLQNQKIVYHGLLQQFDKNQLKAFYA